MNKCYSQNIYINMQPESDIEVNLVEIKDQNIGIECIQCNHWYKNQAQYKSHMWKHTGEKPFPCLVCSRRFTQQGNLKAHMRIHTGEKPFLCCAPNCKARFTQRSNLKAHSKIHTGEKPYKCNECSSAFRQATNLRTHLAIHTGEQPFKCDLCSKCFTQKSNMKAHKDRVHRAYKKSQEPITHLNMDHMQNDDLYNNLNIMIGKDGTDAFDMPSENLITVEADHNMDFSMEPTVEILIPDGCIKDEQFGYPSEKVDYSHMEMGIPYIKEEPGMRIEIVEGNIEDPYNCQICNNTYLSAGDLLIHRCAKGLRYFECDLCKDWMRTLADLKNHQASHSEGKRYSCGLCGLIFNSRHRLKRHHQLHRQMTGGSVNRRMAKGRVGSHHAVRPRLWWTNGVASVAARRRRAKTVGRTPDLDSRPVRRSWSLSRRNRRSRRTTLSMHYAVSYKHCLMLQRKFLREQCPQSVTAAPQFSLDLPDHSIFSAPQAPPPPPTYHQVPRLDHPSAVSITRRTEPSPLFMCSECKSYFSSLGNIKAHMEMHRQTSAAIKKEVLDISSQNVFVISACLKYNEPVAQFSRSE